jgi:integrase
MGHLEHNPLASMKRPTATNREQVISLAEFKAILRHTPGECFRDLLMFSWETGARPQESKGLTADQVDFDNHRCVLHYLDSKGKKVGRVFYMSDRAERIVKRLLPRNGHVFRNTKGDPWPANAVRSRFKRLVSKLGVQYTQYAFRHTWITRAIKADIDPVTVANMAGHANPSMVANVYAHVSQDPEHMRSQLDKLSKPS